ncbi:glycosyltransferase family 4 protein [Sphingoaurantiacus capsulatus]|uniref:Glycosyltransferase family 4 protein n=1 Tax=Sphingoaurantiacus capsulatus TaxID=1771310 RepID=A0ABV7X953_9SPHN
MKRPRLLHLHSTFNLGGKEARAVALMNAWSDAYSHDIVSAAPGETAAAALIDHAVDWRIRGDFPSLEGKPGPGRWRRIAAALAGYDLILTYNWGSMDAVGANRVFAHRPMVHHEDGFNEDETVRQKPKRVMFRRLFLPGVARLVVPSRNLERIARDIWRQPPERIAYVPNGVDLSLFDTPPAADAIPGLIRRPGEVIVGTLAGLRPVKNLPRLVRAFAAATRATPQQPSRLVIIGRGPDEAAIRATAEAEGITDRLVMPGFLAHPHRYVGLFDIFALSSDSEQFPISLVEAMAANLPAASTAVGDVAEIVAAPNRPFLAPPGDEPALGMALARLIGDANLRASVGAANRAKVAADYDFAGTAARYRAIYEAAMRR